jgi:hypothetical protein
MGLARRIAAFALLALVLPGALAVPGAEARKSAKKGLWGPVRIAGESQFPTYRKLGVGVYSTRIRWSTIAQRRPAKARDPRDPAYAWPAEIDDAVAEARKHRMKVAVEVQGVPGWANGGRAANWVPNDPRDFARFTAAASRRYPHVKYWIVWGEPTRTPNFMPLVPQKAADVPLDARRRRAPRAYARILDASYRELKRVDRRDKVVGGNTFVNGDIGPLNFIRALKLPGGRRPRMDLYGHHPFTARRPDLSRSLIRPGMADFSDLDAVARWVDRYLGRAPGGRRIKLWLGEWAMVTDHASDNLNVWVSRATQASWLRSALRIVRRWDRIEALVYFQLRDQAPAADGRESNWGLLDWEGRPKPAFEAFRRG